MNAWCEAVGQMAHMKLRCNCDYIDITVSHVADRIIEAVPTRNMTSSFLKFIDDAQRGTTSDSPGRAIRPSQMPPPDNTQHSQQTSVSAGGIRTRNLSRQAAAGLRRELLFQERTAGPLPTYRSTPSSAAQNRSCQPRGIAGPHGWQR